MTQFAAGKRRGDAAESKLLEFNICRRLRANWMPRRLICPVNFIHFLHCGLERPETVPIGQHE